MKQKKIPLIAALSCTDEYDSRAPYVYVEVTAELVESLASVRSLCCAMTQMSGLKNVTRIALSGLPMLPLASLPPLSQEQEEKLEEDEMVLLDTPIDPETLPVSEVKLSCEELHVYTSGGLYAIACDKYNRDIYEANLSVLNTHLSCPRKPV